MNERVRPPNVDRFAMRAETAAASLDVSLTTFLGWVKEGKMPKPIKLRAVALYDTESVRNAWQALKDGAGRGDGSEWD